MRRIHHIYVQYAASCYKDVTDMRRMALLHDVTDMRRIHHIWVQYAAYVVYSKDSPIRKTT